MSPQDLHRAEICPGSLAILHVLVCKCCICMQAVSKSEEVQGQKASRCPKAPKICLHVLPGRLSRQVQGRHSVRLCLTGLDCSTLTTCMLLS